MDSNKALELAKNAYPHDENLRVAYMLGVDKGYEFCREQMLKDAVEAKTFFLPPGKWRVTALVGKDKIEEGDKVRIIVLKEEE